MTFLAQHGLWGACVIEHCLVVTEHVSGSLEWNSKHAQLVLQCNYQPDCKFERCELRSEIRHLDRILFLIQPHNWCLVVEYQYACL